MKKIGSVKRAVIFGDSYSTFAGYIPEGYATWYSTREMPETDVTRVEETWWYPLCADLGIELVLNDSWSGSTLGHTGYSGDCSKTSSFIFRLERLIENGFFEKETVDTVFVFGCTNDSWANAPLGEIMLDNHKHEDLFSVCPAIGYFAKRLREVLPEANIIFMINTELKPEIGEAIKVSCAHNGEYALELHDIDKRCGHPSVKGMEQIKEQLKEFIENN